MRNKLVSLSLLSLASALALPALAEGEGKVLYDKKCAICHGKDITSSIEIRTNSK